MLRKALLLTVAMTTLAHAATTTALSVTTTAAQNDQATLCANPPTAKYPKQFIWRTSTTVPTPRSALPSDNLTPRIEQWHQGATSPAAVYTSLNSDTSTCSEPFLPAVPVPGGTVQVNGVSYPYATYTLPNGNVETIYSDAILQALANIGCGPFGHSNHTDLFRLWRKGDTFKVYPAVYPGEVQIQPQPDYYTGGTVPTFDPTDITLQGIVVNGIRPVFLRTSSFSGQNDSESGKDVLELGPSANIVSDNIDYGMVDGGYVYFAIVFNINGGTLNYDDNGVALPTPQFGGVITISNARIFGGQYSEQISGGANGVATGESAAGGTFQLLNDEIYDNGGSGVQNSSGPGHNIYISAGADPNFTFVMKQSYSHDAYYGHLVKSRAQNNVIIGNYFQGGLPQGGIYTQAEAYNSDFPNGGTLVYKDNIITKNQSGTDSNGFGLAYGEEGIVDNRTLSLDIENNTFVAFASTFDGSHPITPFFFFYPATTPDMQGFPVANPVVQNNAFVGYCLYNNPVTDYRGDVSLTAGFSETRKNFMFKSTAQYQPAVNNHIVGVMSYHHVAQNNGIRRDYNIGAKD